MNFRYVSVFIGVFLMFSLSQTVLGQSLEELRWKNRVLLIFNAADAIAFSKQQENMIIDYQNGFTERDFLIVDADSEDPQHARFNVEPGDFTVILIGKDGGEKGRWQRPVKAEEIFSLVDQMPMRQREMREKPSQR